MPPSLVRCDCAKCQGNKIARSTKQGHAALRSTSQQAHRRIMVPTLPPLAEGFLGSTVQAPLAFTPQPASMGGSSSSPSLRSSSSFANNSTVDQSTPFAPYNPLSPPHPAASLPILPPPWLQLTQLPVPPPVIPLPLPLPVQAVAVVQLPARLHNMTPALQVQELAAMAAAERRGRQAIRAARAAAALTAEVFAPIADDDWEQNDEEEEDVREADEIREEQSPPLPPSASTDQEPPTTEEEDDIYRVPSRPAPPLPTPNDLHRHPAAYILYLLVVWLHTALHLPFRGCDVVLQVFGYILEAAGATAMPHMLTTLPAVMNHMGAEPEFQALPVCPVCCEVFPMSAPASTVCLRCTIPIFETAVPRSIFSRAAVPPPKPLLRFPTKSIEEQLKDMLAVPGVEEEMDKWRSNSRTAGIYEDFFDGRISREIEGPDGLPFFRPGETPNMGPNDELRVGLTLGVDWFSYLRSQIAPSHTSGPMSFNVVNFRSFLRQSYPSRFSKQRSDKEHRQRQQEYLKCKTAAARKAFVKMFATRWCQLSRLPYFDLCRMIVIDPMHNLLLGLIKTHFYQIWVLHKVLRKTKEMRRFHALLAEAGSQDLWGFPRIPQIWSEYKKVAAAEARKKASVAAAALAAAAAGQPRPQRVRRQTKRAEVYSLHIVQESGLINAQQMDVDPDPPTPNAAPDAGGEPDDDSDYEDPSGSKKRRRAGENDEDSDEEEEREARAGPNLHPDDPANFCKLAAAVKLLMARPITDAQIDQAEGLLRSYLPELIRLAQAANSPPESPMRKSAEAMYRATADDRGTIQALARQLDKAQEDGGVDFELSAKFSIGPVPTHVFHQTLRALQIKLPRLALRSYLLLPTPESSSYPLFNKMKRFPYAIVSNRRYFAAEQAKFVDDSLVLVNTHGMDAWAGELREIFVVDQPKVGIHHYGFVRWFVPASPELLAGSPWAQLPDLKVHLWKPNVYLGPEEDGPGALIQLDDIISHVIRRETVVSETRCWLTVTVKA
ncbi:hypothetical protein C8R47DRAFT_1074460 [Mycena vitilis]|nr:hypothetical protein C8R47DRAFT_1074460 [Mycena vitilis]